MELVNLELRAATRVVTVCPLSIPAYAVMVEAGMDIGHVDIRRTTLAFRVLALASTLPPGDSLAVFSGYGGVGSPPTH